jgi:PTS system mannose-specific IID component
MTGTWRAFLRLFAVQGAWNYERMLGVGMGYAAEPILEDLQSADPARHAEAVVRSAEFFNCHPYLAGVALGALVRAEYDGVPGAQILRLRTALCSPLGALGDRIFWAGLLPALVSAALVLVVFGHGIVAIGLFLLLYNLARLVTAVWGLRSGLAAGMQVGNRIRASWLAGAAERIGSGAGFLVGLAVPMVANWFLEGAALRFVLAVLALTALTLVLTRRYGTVLTSLRLALGALAIALLFRWGLA